MPTFCRSTELKIWPDKAELAVELPTNGRFWPTTMVASSLSAVSSVGADSRFECVSLCNAVISAISHGALTLPLLALLLLLFVVVTAFANEVATLLGMLHLLPEASPNPQSSQARADCRARSATVRS